MCAARTTTKPAARRQGRLPTHRPPTHPGELLEEALTDRELSVAEAARRTGMSAQRLYDIIKGRRNVTAQTAVLLGELFTMSPEFWMNLASDWDLWHAIEARKIVTKAG